MNDTFDLQRFSLLLKKSILERPMQTIGLMGLILAFTLTIYAGCLYFFGWGAGQNLAYIWGFIGGGIFLAAGIFGHFSTNAAGAAYLTLPASMFEKWLTGVLIVCALYMPIFFGFYWLMDHSFVNTYHNSLDRSSPLYQDLYNAVHLFPFDGNIVRGSFMIFFNLTGAVLVGSLYFNRLSVIKTAAVTLGVFAVVFVLNTLLAKLLFHNVDQANPFYNIFIIVGKDMGIVTLPSYASKFADIFFYYVMPAVLWITALIRLREKEI